MAIPCIGYNTFNTQRICHPMTTVEVGDIKSAKRLANKLKTDKQFYNRCSAMTKVLYHEHYSEEVFKKNMDKLINNIVGESR